MEREILELTEKQCRDILYRGYYDSEDSTIRFRTISNQITDNSRWSVSFDLVVQRESDGKFFSAGYSEGATESQCHDPFEYDECKFYEVVELEKTVKYYGWN